MEQYHRDPTINSFYAFLESQVATGPFYAEMMRLVTAEPYFFAPYVEMADYLESVGLKEERTSFLKFAFRRVNEFCSKRGVLESAKKTWTQKEVNDITSILHKYKGVYGPSFRIARLSLMANNLRRSLQPEKPHEYKNLVEMTNIADISRLQREVAENEVCWAYDTSRQDNIPVHQRTNAIVLRSLQNKNREYEAVDGPHESLHTPLAMLFPQTLEVIEKFAKEKNGGLARVALVRLKPHSIVYRHFDSELWLGGRNRYHLVIMSERGSFMTSGIETKLFHEGDIFLFDNKKMHTAENDSNDWRIHVIFDMKV